MNVIDYYEHTLAERGYQPDASQPKEIFWQVFPIGEST